MRKYREPTYVSRVLEYLRQCDDYVPVVTVSQAIHATPHNVTTALWMLLQYKCVESVVSSGKLYWFALPPELDTRMRVVKERAKEEKPRKSKKKKLLDK